MTDASATIARLNDEFRRAAGWTGLLLQTAGIAALSEDDQQAVRDKVVDYDAFTPDNDPHGERYFGSFNHDGEKIFWKIDYYDKAMEYGSEDPTIALRHE